MTSRKHNESISKNSFVSQDGKSPYQNSSIIDTYKNKLYRPQKLSKSGNFLGLFPKTSSSLKQKSSFQTVSFKAEFNAATPTEKILEIRCLPCSCVSNVGLMEASEGILDTLKYCGHSCERSLRRFLLYKNKKEYKSTTSSHFSGSNPSTLLWNPNPGYASSNLKTRALIQYKLSNHSLSHAEERTIVNNSTQIGLSVAQPTSKPSLLDCFQLTGSAKKQENRSAVESYSSGVNSIASLTISIVNNPNDGLKSDDRHSVSNTKKFCHSLLKEYCLLDQFRTAVAGENSSQNSYSTNPYQSNQSNFGFRVEKMRSHSGKKPVRVHLLTGDSILLVFDPKAYVKEVFTQVCAMHSIKESQFFGLSAVVEKEHRFMDLKQRLSKYAPKEWGKEVKRRGSDLSVQPSSVLTLQFQVQYYVEHPRLICNQPSRYHYYLQLKRNVLQCKVPTQDETIVTLAATALHLDFGPFDPTVHTGRYFDPNEYVPAWFMKKWNDEYLWSYLPSLHKELMSVSAFNAQADYIKQASSIDDVPVHYYKLFKTKSEVIPSVVLGIYNQGLRVHHIAEKGLEGPHLLDFDFPWSKVGRLFFAAKRFEIYPEDLPSSRKLTYYTGSRPRSKYLLRLLRDTHSLYMSLTPYVQHARRIDGKHADKKRYRESYISGMNLEERLIGGVEERLVGGIDGISYESSPSSEGPKKPLKFYNSSTSHGSSHTSGIDSDSKQRPYDVDEEDDDNAFADDVDLIEVHGPPNGGVIMVTQQHLNAPPHKSLSVNNLSATFSNEAKVVLLKDADQDTLSNSGTTHSEQTIQTDEAERNAAEENDFSTFLNGPSVLFTPQPKQEPRLSIPNESVLLDTYTMPSKVAQVKSNHKSQLENERTIFPKTHQRSNSLIPDLLNSFPDVPQHKTSDSETSPTNEHISRNHHQQHGSKTFYDDTHTIHRQQRSKSVDIDSACLFTHANPENTKPATRPIKYADHHQQQHVMQGDCDCSQMQRSFSTDSAAHHKTNHRQAKSKAQKCSRHHRHHSMHDAQEVVGAPDSKYFGGKLVHNKSREDLTGSNGTLSRSERKKDIHQVFGAHFPISVASLLTQQTEGSNSAPSTSRQSKTTSCQQLENYRKMSDVCHQTIAAQHRKMSDHRHHHNQHRRRSDVPSSRPVVPPKPSGYAVGAVGYTPKKADVVLRANREKTDQNRHRPVSYHASTNFNFSSNNKRHSCFSDITVTSRPNVYVESFKEVIV